MVRVSPFELTRDASEASLLRIRYLVDYVNQLLIEALVMRWAGTTKRFSKALMSFRNSVRGVVYTTSYFWTLCNVVGLHATFSKAPNGILESGRNCNMASRGRDKILLLLKVECGLVVYNVK